MLGKKIGITLAALSLAACTMAPKYTRPTAPVPQNWPTGAAYHETNTTASAPLISELTWRQVFTDERLQKIIETALDNNRDLRIAALNVERARALYNIQRAQLLPAVNAVGSGSKTQVPADLSLIGSAMVSQQYSVTLGVSSWEIDFFGRIRSLKDQALEEYLATDQARLSTQILLISTIAQAYPALAADRENLKLAESTLASQQAAYTLIERRHIAGLISELDLRRAQTQVDTAWGDIALYRTLVAQDENTLNLLVGAPLPKELLLPDLGSIVPLKELSPGLSSELLLRRPDVLAAEHRLKEANANIGAARAAFFPRISLTTALGIASSDLSRLFNSGQDTWTFAPQISMPIFDARTWSAYRVTKIDKEIAVAQYEKAIQVAFKEVADALAQRGTVEDQLAAQESLVQATAATYRLTDARYLKGIDNYLSVLDAQRSLYAAEKGLITLRLAKLTNLAVLYKALGGGSL